MKSLILGTAALAVSAGIALAGSHSDAVTIDLGPGVKKRDIEPQIRRHTGSGNIKREPSDVAPRPRRRRS